MEDDSSTGSCPSTYHELERVLFAIRCEHGYKDAFVGCFFHAYMCTCVENCERRGAFCLYIVLSQCAVGWQSHSLKKDPSRGALIESSLLLAMGVLNPLQYIHPLGIFCRCDFFFRPFSSDPPSLPGAAM